MTPLFPAHRAAEEFDRALDGQATSAVAERYAELLSAVTVLREAPQVAPRAEFVSDLRSRLMLAAETELVAAPPVARPVAVRTVDQPTRTRRRLGTVAASLVIVGGTAGMAAASSGALPDSPLYPVKRGAEDLSTAVHFGDAAKGTSMLGQASTRLQEVSGLLAEGSSQQALLSSTLDSFASSANGGSAKLFRDYQATGNAQDISTVRDFTASGMATIAALAKGADPTTAGSLRDAADQIADIDQQASTLCVSCGDGGAPLTPPASLASASGAASVNALVARPATTASALAQKIQQAASAHDASRLTALQKAAQAAASQAGTGSGSTGSGLLGGGTGGSGGLGSGGSLAAGVKGGTSAVTGLVSGVTGSISKATQGTPLGGVTSGLDDTVKGTVGGLDKTVGGLTGSGSGSGLLP